MIGKKKKEKNRITQHQMITNSKEGDTSVSYQIAH